MKNNLVKIEFVNNGGAIVIEFNGKRYAFSTKYRIKIIPEEAYIHALKSQLPNIQYLRQYTTKEEQEAFAEELKDIDKKSGEDRDKLIEEGHERLKDGLLDRIAEADTLDLLAEVVIPGELPDEKKKEVQKAISDKTAEIKKREDDNKALSGKEKEKAAKKRKDAELAAHNVLKDIKSCKTKESIAKILAPENLPKDLKDKIKEAFDKKYAELEDSN